MPSHLVVCNIGLHPSLAFDIGYLGDPTTWTFLKMVPREGTVKRKLFVYQQDHTLIQMQDLWESKSAHFHKHLFVLSSSTLYLRAQQNPSVRSFPSVAFETVPVLPLKQSQCCLWNSPSVGLLDDGPFSFFPSRKTVRPFLSELFVM